MKSKRLLRFYFSAEGVDRALNNLITAAGCASFYAPGKGVYYAEKMLRLIEVKSELGLLWNYLDGILKEFSDVERQTLKRYGELRCGFSKLGDEDRRGIRRAAVKFARHARGIERFSAAVELVGEYYSLM